MSKNLYWLSDPAGVLVVAEGAEVRNEWTRAHGYSEVAEPKAGDMVWLQHAEHGGRAKFPIEAAEQWSALGWLPAGPVAAPDLTKDPALVDQPAAEAVPVAAEPVKPKTTSATGGEQSKETSRG